MMADVPITVGETIAPLIVSEQMPNEDLITFMSR